MDLYYDQVNNPHTLARLRQHLDEHHCLQCLSRLEAWLEAEQTTVAWLTTRQPAPVPEKTPAPPLLASSVRALWERFKDAALQAGTLLLDAPYGLAPAGVPGFRTPTPPVIGYTDDDALYCELREAYDDGGLLQFGSEHAAYAGSLLVFECVSKRTAKVLL